MAVLQLHREIELSVLLCLLALTGVVPLQWPRRGGGGGVGSRGDLLLQVSPIDKGRIESASAQHQLEFFVHLQFV